ncbi:MAG: exodeoxyribonuclease III [Psittacicella sp.]
MKIVSFNVNGIRARFHQIEALIKEYSPDIIGLQEIKVQDSEFPIESLAHLGYHIFHHGQKGHYGVALFSKLEPISVEKGFPTDDLDAQKRIIIGNFETSLGKLKVINGYFPQGESLHHETKFPAKEKFYKDLNTYLEEYTKPTDNVIVMGDINICPVDKDIGIGEINAKRWLRTGKSAFLPIERQWIKDLTSHGVYDSFRVKYPEATEKYSWFDYRSKGFNDNRGLRIDIIFASAPLVDHIVDSGIALDIRAMEKSSDHAPVWTIFE